MACETKKYLELARYYLKIGESKKAQNNINKVFAEVKGKDTTIFAMHPNELREKII